MNFRRVFTVWGDFTRFLPTKTDRQLYFDEDKDLEGNIELIHRHALTLYKNQRECAKWGKKRLVCISLAFDLIDALVSYEGRPGSVMHIKLMLIDSLQRYVETVS